MNNNSLKSLVFMGSLTASIPSSGTTYSVIDLSAKSPRGSQAMATGLNNQGTVVGIVTTVDTSNKPIGRIAIFKNGDMQLIPDVNPSLNKLFDGLKINASEQVAGSFTPPTPAGAQPSAFLYSNGVFTDLASTLGASFASGVSGLNDAGQVVGYVESANGLNGYLLTGNAVTAIAPAGYLFSFARGINAQGQVVGRAAGLTESRAFFYDPQSGTTVVLGFGSAIAINSSGLIVGSSVDQNLDQHAAIFDLSGAVHQISPCSSAASDVNDSGIVVGSSQYCLGGFSGGFVYDANDPNAQPISLTALAPQPSSWFIDAASSINALGQIAASAHSFLDGREHAVLLNPTN